MIPIPAPLLVAIWFSVVVIGMLGARFYFARRGRDIVSMQDVSARVFWDFLLYSLPLIVLLAGR